MSGRSTSGGFGLKGIYIGWPKCGSTWLFRFLDAHPDVVVPQQKDTHYFDRFHDRGREWFVSQFGASKGAEHSSKICVDIGHDCIFSEDALARISREEPEATIFVGMRDPVQWVLSEYAYVSGTGRVQVSFEQYLTDYEYALSYARYEVWLQKALEHFRREKLKFLILEDLSARPEEYVREVASGLDVSADTSSFFDINQVVNPKQVARNDHLLTLARAASAAGERIGLRDVVQVVKRSPLRSLVFKRAKSAALDAERLATLQPHRRQFAATVEAVSELLGQDLRKKWVGMEC